MNVLENLNLSNRLKSPEFEKLMNISIHETFHELKLKTSELEPEDWIILQHVFMVGYSRGYLKK